MMVLVCLNTSLGSYWHTFIDMYSDEMTHLENKLSGLGYRFMITKDGERIYSNLSDEDLEIARSVAGDVRSM